MNLSSFDYRSLGLICQVVLAKWISSPEVIRSTPCIVNRMLWEICNCPPLSLFLYSVLVLFFLRTTLRFLVILAAWPCGRQYLSVCLSVKWSVHQFCSLFSLLSMGRPDRSASMAFVTPSSCSHSLMPCAVYLVGKPAAPSLQHHGRQLQAASTTSAPPHQLWEDNHCCPGQP